MLEYVLEITFFNSQTCLTLKKKKLENWKFISKCPNTLFMCLLPYVNSHTENPLH